MAKKIFYAIAAVAVFASALFFDGFVSAKNDADYALPEAEGVYDVPGNPHMKLRVFVYHAKPEDVVKEARGGKPAPETPALVCGLADPGSDSVVSAAGWKLPSAWSYDVNLESVPSTIGASNAEILIANSYAAWESQLGGKVDFSRGSTTTTATSKLDYQNIVAWGRTSGTALAVTYTWYYPSTGEVVEIDTIMNKKFTWYWSGSTSCAYQGVYDAQNILTHELGHTVGLSDEYNASSFGNNTMYGYGSKWETKKNTLTNGDIIGARAIYGL